jgi:DNA mismatch repair protein MutL
VSPSPSRPHRSIRRLLPTTVERIAAGEVVERPASVVKELVENAIDAGARTVTVRLQGGGIERVEVADDGDGIPADELELAIERHATSKLAPEGPVERVDSLGFRGEALAAIGAVARLRLLSRPPERDVAEGISVVGGELVGRFTAPRATGTTVEVEDLFFRTPARRKFLKSPAAEQLEVVRTVERLYLARPTVGLRLEGEGREIATYPPTARLRDAASRVIGPQFVDASFELVGDVPGGRVFGALGLPTVAAAASTSLYLAVNGRTIVSRPLTQAVRVAYADTLPKSRYPVGLLHLELDLGELDVNVHPTKREVRFAHERELGDALRRLVREQLLATPRAAVPRSESAGRSSLAPGRLPAAEASPVVAAARPAQRTFDLPPAARPSPGRQAQEPRRRLELLGPLHSLYWVAAGDDGLVLIDQHAASERLLFDALRRDGSLARQSLVEPVTVRLSGAQRAALEAAGEAVRAAGFEVEPFGAESVRVRAVPSYRGRRARPEAVVELLDELAAGGRSTVGEGLEDRTAATIACHAAIRAGDAVEPATIADMLEELERQPEGSRTCPHGRPIMVRLPRSRLDRWFLRSGS